MPCRDWLDAETNAADERIKNLQQDMGKIRTKLNTLTRLLCEAGAIINKAEANDEMSRELKDWLWEHNKEDRKRQK